MPPAIAVLSGPHLYSSAVNNYSFLTSMPDARVSSDYCPGHLHQRHAQEGLVQHSDVPIARHNARV